MDASLAADRHNLRPSHFAPVSPLPLLSRPGSRLPVFGEPEGIFKDRELQGTLTLTAYVGDSGQDLHDKA